MVFPLAKEKLLVSLIALFERWPNSYLISEKQQ